MSETPEQCDDLIERLTRHDSECRLNDGGTSCDCHVDMCGADAAVRIAQLEDTVRRLSEPDVLDAPAMVGNTIFGTGVSHATVIDRAKREARYKGALQMATRELLCHRCGRSSIILAVNDGRPECLRADCVERRG